MRVLWECVWQSSNYLPLLSVDIWCYIFTCFSCLMLHIWTHVAYTFLVQIQRRVCVCMVLFIIKNDNDVWSSTIDLNAFLLVLDGLLCPGSCRVYDRHWKQILWGLLCRLHPEIVSRVEAHIKHHLFSPHLSCSHELAVNSLLDAADMSSFNRTLYLPHPIPSA